MLKNKNKVKKTTPSYILKLSSNRSIITILIIVTFITYINILPNQLFFDDEELIYKNVYIQNLVNFPRYFTQNMIAGAGKISNMYRPVLLISYALDHLVWGLNPFGYHLTSILLHAGNSILLYLIVSNLFTSKLLAFLTAIIFIVHPVQSEAIIYASGRTDPLYTFFALLSILFFISYLKSKLKSKLKYISSLIYFILSLLSKETAIILPILLLPVALSYFKGSIKKLLKKIFVIIPYFIISLIYIILRATLLNFSNTFNFYTYKNIYSENITIRFYTFTKTFFDYLKIILFPKELIIARNPQIVISPLNLWTALFIIIIISLTIVSVIRIKKNTLFLFSLFWFLISIFPVSGAIPINNIMAEHYLYLPSISFFLTFSFIFLSIYKKLKSKITRLTLSSILVLLILLFITRTFIRTFDFRNPITFYTVSLNQSPQHTPMRNNLAMAYAELGKTNLAINEYKKAIEISDIYPNTHHNLANAYKEIGEYALAEKEYLKAIEMDSNFFFSYYGLMDLYNITGEKEKVEILQKKISK